MRLLSREYSLRTRTRCFMVGNVSIVINDIIFHKNVKCLVREVEEEKYG